MCSSLVRDTRAQCEEGCAVSCKCCSSTKDESCRHRDEDDAERDASCGCCSGDADVDSDDDDDDEDPSVLRKKICASAVLLVVAVVINRAAALSLWAQLVTYLPAYLVAGWGVLREAAESIAERRPFDEDFLMSVATLGALLIGFVPGGEPQFAEAVFVMLFFQVGELFEGMAQESSRRSIRDLMQIRPDVAYVERDGEVVAADPNDVAVGDVMVVRPGEKIALDGVVIEGQTSLDTVALTGESVPRDAGVGDDVASGCVNLTGLLRVRVTRGFGESTASRIIDLVQNASRSKSRSENFIKRFARVYTPVVVYLAMAVALVPPIFSPDFAAALPTWVLRALTFLVVSCPCALVLSVPLTFFGGIGGASRRGILVKGSNYLEALAKAQTVVFDKTGTLTKGTFKVTQVHPSNMTDEELLHLAAHVEANSTHPIAAALRLAFPLDDDDCVVSDVTEEAGHGVVATVNGHRVAVGNAALMRERCGRGEAGRGGGHPRAEGAGRAPYRHADGRPRGDGRDGGARA